MSKPEPCSRCQNTGICQSGAHRGKKCKAKGCRVFADFLRKSRGRDRLKVSRGSGKAYAFDKDGALRLQGRVQLAS
jgi:hypothetical protein